MTPQRKPLRQYCIRKRHLGLRAAERLEILQLKKKIKFISKLLFLNDDDNEEEILFLLFLNYYCKWKRIYYEVDFQLPPPVRIVRKISNYSDEEIYSKFRLQNQIQLSQLFNALKIPQEVLLENGIKMFGEEIFLFSLKRLQYPCRIQDMLEEFGGEVFKYTLYYFDYFI